MPRHRGLTAEEQKEVNRKVANAMEMAANARRLVEQHRKLGHIPSAGSKAMPMNVSGMPRPSGPGIVGGTIGSAVIGSDKPVKFSQKTKVFNKGAETSRVKILGGDFIQANFGGTVTTNNTKTNVGTTPSQGRTAIKTEDLLVEIFQKDISASQLTQLLERGYTLANIAFSLPRDAIRRDRMIDVLLA